MCPAGHDIPPLPSPAPRPPAARPQPARSSAPCPLDPLEIVFFVTAGTTKNQLDGNNSFQLLSCLDKLEAAKLGGTEADDDSELLLPATAQPIIDTMKALLKVVEGTMGHGLNPEYKGLISTYR